MLAGRTFSHSEIIAMFVCVCGGIMAQNDSRLGKVTPSGSWFSYAPLVQKGKENMWDRHDEEEDHLLFYFIPIFSLLSPPTVTYAVSEWGCPAPH